MALRKDFLAMLGGTADTTNIPSVAPVAPATTGIRKDFLDMLGGKASSPAPVSVPAPAPAPVAQQPTQFLFNGLPAAPAVEPARIGGPRFEDASIQKTTYVSPKTDFIKSRLQENAMTAQGIGNVLINMPANIERSAEMVARGLMGGAEKAAEPIKKTFKPTLSAPASKVQSAADFKADMAKKNTVPHTPSLTGLISTNQKPLETAGATFESFVGKPDETRAVNKFGYGAGQFIGNLGMAAILPGGATIAALNATGQTSRDVQAAGGSKDDEVANSIIAGIVNAVGMSKLANGISVAMANPALSRGVKASIAKMAGAMAESGGFNVVQGAATNAMAQGTFDPNRKIMTGQEALSLFGQGAAGGGLFHALPVAREIGSSLGRSVMAAQQSKATTDAMLRAPEAVPLSHIGKASETDIGSHPTFDAIDNYARNAWDWTPGTPKLESKMKLGPVSEEAASAVSQITGKTVNGYRIALVDNDIRHIRNRHGPETTEGIPVVPADFMRVQDIVNNFDRAYEANPIDSTGGSSVRFEKRYNGKTYLLTAISEDDGTLGVKQIIKVPSESVPKFVSKAKGMVSRVDVPSEDVLRNHAQNALGHSPDSITPPNAADVNAPGGSLPADVAGNPELNVPADSTTSGADGVNLQQFGLTTPGPMDGTGPIVESKLSANIAKGRVGNDAITEAYKADPVTHAQLTHTQTIETMNRKMDGYDGTPNGLDKVFDEWSNRVENKKYDAADVALTRVLANEFTKQGRQYKADQAYAMLIEKQTEMGRLIDATKLLYEASSPAAVKTVLDRFVKTINKEGAEKYGKKWNDMALTPEEVQRIHDLSKNGTLSQENIDLIKEEVATRMAGEMPRTAGEVMNSWRRFAMLTSPKTHIRNIISNAIRAVMEGQKNITATFLEKVLRVPADQRIHAIGWKSDGLSRNNARVDAVNLAWNQNEKVLSSTMKYEISSLGSLEARKDAFKPGLVKKASGLVMNALQAEDVWFMRPAFKSALGQMMKVQNVDVPTPAMITRAKNVALDVTFKKMNGLSTAILKWKRTGGIVGGAAEAVLPFVTTPAAIAKTTVEYSPVGFIKTLLDAKSNPEITKADQVDALAKSVTGTSYIVAGLLAGAAGILTGENEKSKKAKEINELGGGRQQYSVKIPQFLGGGTYTMDWIQPTGTLFFIGAQMGQDIAKGKVDYSIDGAIDMVLAGADTFFNQSMLKGVKSIFQNPGSTAEGIANIGADYINQFIPTLWSQVVKGTDPYQRIGYGGGWLTSAGKMIQSKISPQGLPGVVKPLEPNMGVYGEPKPMGYGNTEVGNTISGLALSILSPGFYKPETTDPTAKEVYRVYQSTKDTGVVPTTIPSEIGPKKLTDAEKTQFATEYGKGAYSAVARAIASPSYKLAKDDFMKADILRKAMQNTYETERMKMARK